MDYPEKRRITWIDDETGDLVGACDYYRHDLLEAARAEIERLGAAIDAWRTAFWVMDGHAVAIHDAEGKCYSVRAHDYIVMHDLHRAALAQEGLTND